MKTFKFTTSSGIYKLQLESINTIDSRITYQYKFFTPDNEILFQGCDFTAYYTDGLKSCAYYLLGFLTVQLGDTDKEYFKDYTDDQLTFTESFDCQELSMLVYDFQENER